MKKRKAYVGPAAADGDEKSLVVSSGLINGSTGAQVVARC